MPLPVTTSVASALVRLHPGSSKLKSQESQGRADNGRMSRRSKQLGMWTMVLGAIVLAFMGLGSPAAIAAPSGSISGTVSGGGSPLSGICVNVENGPGAQTDASGAYTITGLGMGSFRLLFADCNTTPQYVTEWWFHHPDQGSADLVAVTDGADTSLPDMEMSPGVLVSGRVTDTGGNPIPGVTVTVQPTNQGSPTAPAQTDADGRYSTTPLRPGDYKVQFSDTAPIPQWAQQYWTQKPSWNTADTLTLSTTASGQGIDAQLSAAARISGTVTGPGGAPLSGICIDANVANNGGYDFVAGATTTATGQYTIEGLPTTDLRIRFHDCNPATPYVEQWYDAKPDVNSATPVVLVPGEDRPHVDAQLATGVSVAGRVTDGAGNPVWGISVSVNPTDKGPGAFAQTDLNGMYVTSAVAPGDYRVQFSDAHPAPLWATQYWNAKLSWNSADILTVSAADGAVHGNINATLNPAATVTGTVTAPSGAPAGDICVNAVVDTPNGPDGVAYTTTVNDGSYRLGGLPATAVKIVFQDCHSAGPYLSQWWNNQPDFSSAEPLTLAPGETRPGIDAHLAPAAEITGTVTDTNGHPLEGICAQATTATFVGGLARTDPDGRYAIALARPGDYRVQFVDCNQAPTFAGQWWKNQPTPATATAVTVGTAQVVDGIDAQLAPGAPGAISGKVLNLHGIGMTSVCVVAYLANDYPVVARVGADGTYRIANVPSGTWALAFVGCQGDGDPQPTIENPESPGTRYPAVWWNGATLDIDNKDSSGPDPIAQGANLVTVTPGQDLTGYDRCFGCDAISISNITAGSDSITIAFETPGLLTTPNAAGDQSARAAQYTYTATCTSNDGGAPGATSGPTSAITVGKLTPGATYTCQVTASDGRVTVAQSALSHTVLVPVPAVVTTPTTTSPTTTTPSASTPSATAATTPTAQPGPTNRTSPSPTKLAFTGSDSPRSLAPAALALLGVGLGLLAATRQRRGAAASPR